MGVSVNVPPSVLQDDDLLATVEDTLALYDLAPDRLTIEVTETQLAENPELLFAKLAALRELGVRVSIDDFGTGYSSLAYFRHLPADEIKIDKSFILNMRTSPTDDAIVRTVIDLCHKLSLRVVAEGIEDKATAEKLRDYGCDVMQGFHIDKPLPPTVLEQRYRLA